jgi:hypothetical protein
LRKFPIGQLQLFCPLIVLQSQMDQLLAHFEALAITYYEVSSTPKQSPEISEILKDVKQLPSISFLEQISNGITKLSSKSQCYHRVDNSSMQYG